MQYGYYSRARGILAKPENINKTWDEIKVNDMQVRAWINQRTKFV